MNKLIETPEAAIHSRSAKAVPLHSREMMLHSSPQQPSPPMTPCPPGSIGINPRLNKGVDIRARHLNRVSTPSKTTGLRATATITYMGDETFLPTNIDDNVVRTQTAIQPTTTPLGELNRRFASGTGKLEHNSSQPTVAKFISSNQPVIRSSTKAPVRPSPPHAIRPITATGILQRLRNRPILLTTSKTSST